MSLTAIGLILISAAIHAGWNFLTKTSAHPRAFMLVKCVCYLIVMPCVLPFFALGEVPPAVWGFAAGSAVVHAIYAFALATAYTHGDISLVYPIARSAPAVIPIFAIWLLGEQLTLGGAAGIALAVVAVWIVNTNGRLRLDIFTAPGSGFAYLTLGTVVAYSLVDKSAMHRFHAATWSGIAPRALAYMVIAEAAAAALYLTVMLPVLPREAVRVGFREEKLRAAVSTVGEILSYAIILYVYRTESVSYVVAVRQASVIIVVLLGTLVLKEPFGRPRLFGAVTLFAAVYLIARFS